MDSGLYPWDKVNGEPIFAEFVVAVDPHPGANRRVRAWIGPFDEHSVGRCLHANDSSTIPRQSLLSLLLRFLRFGALAWGGPVVQIALIRQSLVDEEHWVTSEHFNRVLALYQVLPGPEAHELCVYFGMLARGRLGGLLAGLAFMLPGFPLIFALSWAYVELGLDMEGKLALLFATIQAAVVALIARAVHRIGSHVLLDRWLWAIGVLAFAGQLMGIHVAISLFAGGIAYFLVKRRRVDDELAVHGWHRAIRPATCPAHHLHNLRRVLVRGSGRRCRHDLRYVLSSVRVHIVRA